MRKNGKPERCAWGTKWFIEYYRVGEIELCKLFGVTIYRHIGNLYYVLGYTFEKGKDR